MALLDKLSICGIRSFGCGTEDKQSISFGKPLTLILGDNGCGKSTIIECLRYITAQKEPSGRGVFVHDPDLAGSATVKAYVKLRLKDSKDQSVHLFKALQATRSRKAIQTKNLDAAITLFDPIKKEHVSISNRCADFSPEVMRILGVSKPILENVIFCTQEDAMWPLDTDLKLKEKFDQIFDSDKYNKCLKKVRDQRKLLAIEKKQREVELKHLKENKCAAQRKRNELMELEHNITRLNDEIVVLNDALLPVKERLKRVDEQERELSKVHTLMKTTETELRGVTRAADELRAKIQAASCLFPGTDEELESALENCNVQSRNVNQLKAELSDLKSQEETLTDRMGASIGRVGQLTKLIEINKSKIEQKEHKMRALGNQFGMTSAHLSEDGLERRVMAKKGDVEKVTAQHEAEEDSMQAELEKTRDKVVQQESDISRKADAVQSNSREREELRRELVSVEESTVRRERVASELRAAEQTLTQHQQSASVRQLDDELLHGQTELSECEAALGEAEKNTRRLQEFAEVGSKLELQKDDLKRKSGEMRRLQNYHQETLLDVLGTVPESGFKRAVESRAEKLQANLRDLRGRKTTMEGEVITFKNNAVSISSSLQKKKAELEIFMDKVNELTSGEDLNETVKRIEEQLNDLQDEKGALTSSNFMYDRYIRALMRAKPCCPLCSRDFAAEEEARTLVNDLNYKKREVPAKLERVNEELIEKQEKHRMLIALQSQQDKFEKLKNDEIPALVKEQEEKKVLASQTRKNLDDVGKQLQRAEKNREACMSMLGDMALLDQLTTDLGKVKLEMEQLEARLPVGWTKSELTDAEATRANLQSDRKRKQEACAQAQRRVNEYKETLLKLQSKKHSLAEEELKLRSIGGQLKQQEDRLALLQGQAATLRQDLEAARTALRPLEQAKAQKMQQLKQLKDAHKGESREKQTELDALMEQLKDVRRLQQEIVEFERKGEAASLIDLKAEIKAKEDNIKSLKVKIENINSKLGDLSKSVVRRRELEDNKALRGKMREKDEIEKKFSEIKDKFGGLGFEALVQEKKKLKAEEEANGQRKANISGKKGAIEGQMGALKKELNSPMYKDIDGKFKEELVQMHIADAMATDLLRYATAMEYAMGVYHERQMKRVNGIVREYWRTIYRGNDVDYIEVHTLAQTEVTENRRNISYKLVQVKGDVRLDMRGRCSAGQKMLASLIIRMALAEVFSNNCGILTLDEPTTNLDRKNIQNLATALNELIANKQRLLNSNFQLIVITHDKNFLNELIVANGVEEYVQVRRNRDGKSQLSVHAVERS